MTDIAGGIVRQRRWIALGCAVMGLLLLPFAPQTSAKLEVGGATVHQSEAARVDTLMKTRFVAPFANNLVLVATGISSLEEVSGIDIDVLFEIVEAVETVPSVTDILSYIDPVDPVFLSPYGTFLVVGISLDARRMDEVVMELRGATRALQARLRTTHPAIDLSWTGAGALDYDLRLTSATDAVEAERRVLPVTLILLFVVFGSVVSALCPVIIGGLGVALSLGAAVLISPYWPMTILLENIVTMIGLGIGIDYCLLMLGRFREEMFADPDPERSAIKALRTAGHTIVLSGSAVAIGFAALLVVPAAELRSIATGGLLVVAFSVFLATVLLPGLLTWLGARVEAGRLWRPRVASAPRWQAWGRWVTSHPVLVLVIFGLPLAALALQSRHISTDIPTGTWLPEQMESTQGATTLQRMGKSGIVQTIRVVVDFPGEQVADSEEGWHEILRLTRHFESDDRVARVQSLPRLLGVENAEQAGKAIIPPELRAAYISTDGQLASIEIIPSETASAGALMRYVRELRDIYPSNRNGPEGTGVLVGGLPALNADYQDAIGGSVVNVVLLIVVGSFVALLLGFRSLLGAFKAVALNLFSVAAAMGVTVLVFQQGYGSEWLGVAHPLDGLFPAVPIIVFCVVFGLSMDYEVFLLSRVAEGIRKGMSNRDAVVHGLSQTAGIISSAALVMVVVFAGFAMGDFLVIKILGFSLAVAILFDATLVRLAIGPALLQLGGRWNWWPGIR